MAGGNNKSFRNNPQRFIRTHQLMISPFGHGSQRLTAGAMNIDLVSIDPHNAQFIRLEDFALRQHNSSARCVSAYFLPAVVDNTSTLAIGGARDYMFTADLSGCLFAAYGANSTNITVEHVNVRTGAAVVPILGRAQAIINANYNYYKILSPVPIPNANPAHVKTYNANSSVVGIRRGGWQFHYKPNMNAIAQL